MRLFNNEKKIIVLNRKKFSSCIILIVFIVFTFIVVRVFSIYSMQLKEVMKTKANNSFQNCVNDAVINVQKNRNYNFVEVVYKEGEVSAVNYNSQEINFFKAEVMRYVLKNINDERFKFRVYWSDAFKNPVFLNKGPFFDVYCIPHNGIKVECYSKFEDAGVNQTKNSMWFEIVADVYASSEVFNTSNSFKYAVLVSENVIVGQVPESYTSVSGDEQTKDTVLNLQ